jgi:hypothetical protein
MLCNENGVRIDGDSSEQLFDEEQIIGTVLLWDGDRLAVQLEHPEHDTVYCVAEAESLQACGRILVPEIDEIEPDTNDETATGLLGPLSEREGIGVDDGDVDNVDGSEVVAVPDADTAGRIVFRRRDKNLVAVYQQEMWARPSDIPFRILIDDGQDGIELVNLADDGSSELNSATEQSNKQTPDGRREATEEPTTGFDSTTEQPSGGDAERTDRTTDSSDTATGQPNERTAGGQRGAVETEAGDHGGATEQPDERTPDHRKGDYADTGADRSPNDSVHSVPTRVRIFNGDTGTQRLDNDASPSSPSWSDEPSAKEDYQSNLRLFADPEAGTFRCYLNVRRPDPEQEIADVSVDESPPGGFLEYCAQAVTREIRRQDWRVDPTATQPEFDILRGEADVERIWSYDEQKTAELVDIDQVSLAVPNRATAMGVVKFVRERWPDGTSVAVAGSGRDGISGDADVHIKYSVTTDEVTATGETKRRLDQIRLENATATINDQMSSLEKKADEERLGHVRAAAWIENALGRALGTSRRRDVLPFVGNDREFPTVRRTGERFQTNLRRLFPAVSVLLTLVAVAGTIVLLGQFGAALGVLTRRLTVVLGGPAAFVGVAENGSGLQVSVWQLLLATVVPPAVTVLAWGSPIAVFTGQGDALNTVWRWWRSGGIESLQIKEEPTFAEAIETTETVVANVNNAEPDNVEQFLQNRLDESELQVTTQSSPGLGAYYSRRVAVDTLVAVTVTLVVLLLPLLGVIGRAESVTPYLPLAAVASFLLSWTGTVVVVQRSTGRNDSEPNTESPTSDSEPNTESD